MRWIDKLSKAQRVVVVIALGVALGDIASYLASLGMRFGWYAYSPLTGQQYQPPGNGLTELLRLVIWLAAIGLWAFASVTVLRPSPGQAAPD